MKRKFFTSFTSNSFKSIFKRYSLHSFSFSSSSSPPPSSSSSSSSSSTPSSSSSSSSSSISYHRRPLPSSLISLSSLKGKLMFKQSLLLSTLECYFPLSEQFITQSEPSFCSLSSLTMVLNALNYDPKITWKGIWRWITEETLLCHSNKLCGHTKEKIKIHGMNFEDFEALKVCQEGIFIKSFRASDNKIENFRELVINNCSAIKHDSFIICNFSRGVLNQTGDGHFSPIGGYHQESDSVLILDVARFKYPPYWVKLVDLWNAMLDIDTKTGLSRGYFIVSSNSLICCPNYPHNKYEDCLQTNNNTTTNIDNLDNLDNNNNNHHHDDSCNHIK